MNIYELTDTWDDAGVTWAGIKLNVTNTASGASSNLIDLAIGGVSHLKVNNLGQTTLSAGGVTNRPVLLLECGAGIGGFSMTRGISTFYIKSVGEANFTQVSTNNGGMGFNCTGNALATATRGAFHFSQDLNSWTGFAALMDLGTVAANPKPAARVVQDTVVKATWNSDGSITAPTLTLTALPTVNPGVTGALWNDAGTLKVSA